MFPGRCPPRNAAYTIGDAVTASRNQSLHCVAVRTGPAFREPVRICDECNVAGSKALPLPPVPDSLSLRLAHVTDATRRDLLTGVILARVPSTPSRAIADPSVSAFAGDGGAGSSSLSTPPSVSVPHTPRDIHGCVFPLHEPQRLHGVMASPFTESLTIVMTRAARHRYSDVGQAAAADRGPSSSKTQHHPTRLIRPR